LIWWMRKGTDESAVAIVVCRRVVGGTTGKVVEGGIAV
jgi:hypothetical protein